MNKSNYASPNSPDTNDFVVTHRNQNVLVRAQSGCETTQPFEQIKLNRKS